MKSTKNEKGFDAFDDLRQAGVRLEVLRYLAIAVFLAALLGYLFIEGDASQLSDPSMRILWQLIQGSLAGLVVSTLGYKAGFSLNVVGELVAAGILARWQTG